MGRKSKNVTVLRFSLQKRCTFSLCFPLENVDVDGALVQVVADITKDHIEPSALIACEEWQRKKMVHTMAPKREREIEDEIKNH